MTETTLKFSARTTRRRSATKRPLGDKLQEIAFLDASLDSHELEALDILADMVLERLRDDQEKQKAQVGGSDPPKD